MKVYTVKLRVEGAYKEVETYSERIIASNFSEALELLSDILDKYDGIVFDVIVTHTPQHQPFGYETKLTGNNGNQHTLTH